MDASHRPQRFPWRLFWLLFIIGIFGALAIIPIAIDLFGPTIAKTRGPSLPLPVIIFIAAVQNLGMLALMVFVGLKLGRKLGLGAPLLESCLAGDRFVPAWRQSFKEGLITGIAIGLVLLILVLVLVPLLPNLPLVTAAKLAVWKRLLACFYGGLYEEIFMRLFLLTLIAWIANKALRKQTAQLSAPAFWTANVLVAILFGLGHLPSASLVMPITPFVVVVALILNGIAALAFGFLYRRRGLESAMIAHFTADFVIYVLGPSFLST